MIGFYRKFEKILREQQTAENKQNLAVYERNFILRYEQGYTNGSHTIFGF